MDPISRATVPNTIPATFRVGETAPLAPALTLDTGTLSLEQACERLFQQLCPRVL